MMQIAINMNWACRVTLNDHGKRIWAARFPRTLIPENGEVHMQIHHLMSVFGPHVYEGPGFPFATEVIVKTDELRITSS